MIGAFYQPRAVIIDTATLSTLPPRELSAGLAEVIKYGLIMDRPFLEWLEQNLPRLLACEPDAVSHAVLTSCQNKAKIVGEDEHEQGVRALLNLGHTFGHAIEAGLGYGKWLHGEAVATGCAMAARLSCLIGHLSDSEVARVRLILQRAGLPVDAPDLGVDRYLELMGHDKKTRDGKINLILLRSLGDAYLTNQAPLNLLREVLASARADA
jgi:3-dehydroquinate synthase